MANIGSQSLIIQLNEQFTCANDLSNYNWADNLKTTIDKSGQYIAKDLMPLTPMEEAEKTILTRDYRLAKGNISRTARMVGWPRTKVLRKLKEWKLYDLYKHEPGPFKKDT